MAIREAVRHAIQHNRSKVIIEIGSLITIQAINGQNSPTF